MSDSARQAARRYLAGLRGLADPMLAPWWGATLGEPELVRTVELEPSYFLVPAVREGRTLGYVEVGLEGQALGHRYLYRHPDDLPAAPLTPEEARRDAEAVLAGHHPAEVAGPVLVHDGPRNRLAWMFEVRREGRLVSRVYVASGFVYERKPGEPAGRPGLRG